MFTMVLEIFVASVTKTVVIEGVQTIHRSTPYSTSYMTISLKIAAS
jgi:hypothetical protein